MTHDAINPMAMARFLVLPGASRLLEAFAAIPPGALRDNVIQHAELLAEQYTGAPVAQRHQPPVMDGNRRFTAVTGPAPRQEPKTESLESEIIKRRLNGDRPAIIAHDLKCTTKDVYGAIARARSAGVQFPKRELVGVEVGSKRWITQVSDLTAQGRAQVEKAAVARSIDPQAYLDRRSLTLKLAQEGASWETILRATGETSAKVCSAWLSVARAAGHNVPYVTFLQVEESMTQPAPGRVFPTAAATGPRGEAAMRGAAARRNMTLQAYEDLRESIVQHRLAGKSAAEIAHLTGETLIAIKDVLSAAKRTYGVNFPAPTYDHQPVSVELASRQEHASS